MRHRLQAQAVARECRCSIKPGDGRIISYSGFAGNDRSQSSTQRHWWTSPHSWGSFRPSLKHEVCFFAGDDLFAKVKGLSHGRDQQARVKPAAHHTAMKRCRRPQMRWIMDSGFARHSSELDKATTLDGGIAALRSELGALSNSQLEIKVRIQVSQVAKERGHRSWQLRQQKPWRRPVVVRSSQ